jgi:hypothetical protein
VKCLFETPPDLLRLGCWDSDGLPVSAPKGMPACELAVLRSTGETASGASIRHDKAVEGELRAFQGTERGPSWGLKKC